MSEEEDAASSHATSDGSDGRRTTDREALVFRSRVARLISQARERKGDLKRQRKVVRLLRRRPGKPGGGDDGGDSSSDNSDSTSGGEGSGACAACEKISAGSSGRAKGATLRTIAMLAASAPTGDCTGTPAAGRDVAVSGQCRTAVGSCACASTVTR